MNEIKQYKCKYCNDKLSDYEYMPCSNCEEEEAWQRKIVIEFTDSLNQCFLEQNKE